MRLGVILFLLIFALGLACGCFDRQDVADTRAPGLYVDESRHLHICDLKENDTVISVNGERIYKRDFTALMKLKEGICCLRTGNPFPSEEDLQRIQVENGQWIVYELMHHALFRQYAKKIKAVPGKDAIEQARKNLLMSLKRPKDSLESLAVGFSPDAAKLLLDIPYVDAQDLLLRQSVSTNDLSSVSEEELENRRKFVEIFDANADAMNKKAKERLLKAKAEIVAGADFYDVTKRYAEVNPQYGRQWGTFQIQETLSEEDLHDWLLKAKIGDISDPVDTDDGLAIVKLVAMGKGDAPPGQPRPDTYTLIRCTVKACEHMRHQDKAEMTQQLLIWKNQEAQKVLGLKLMAEAVIAYPNGTNLFDRVDVDR